MSDLTYILGVVVTLGFVGFVVAAMIFDAWKFQIPNFISIGLVGLFVVAGLLNAAAVSWLVNIAIGAGIFVVAAVMFAYRLLGGGDVKMLAAVSLWMGLDHAADFLLLVGLLGGVLGLVLIILRRFSESLARIWSRFGRQLPGVLAAGKNVPYGLAIGAAALIVSPHLALLPWF